MKQLGGIPPDSRFRILRPQLTVGTRSLAGYRRPSERVENEAHSDSEGIRETQEQAFGALGRPLRSPRSPSQIEGEGARVAPEGTQAHGEGLASLPPRGGAVPLGGEGGFEADLGI